MEISTILMVASHVIIESLLVLVFLLVLTSTVGVTSWFNSLTVDNQKPIGTLTIRSISEYLRKDRMIRSIVFIYVVPLGSLVRSTALNSMEKLRYDPGNSASELYTIMPTRFLNKIQTVYIPFFGSV